MTEALCSFHICFIIVTTTNACSGHEIFLYIFTHLNRHCLTVPTAGLLIINRYDKQYIYTFKMYTPQELPSRCFAWMVSANVHSPGRTDSSPASNLCFKKLLKQTKYITIPHFHLQCITAIDNRWTNCNVQSAVVHLSVILTVNGDNNLSLWNAKVD
jgi:hypothetical protein